MSKTIYSLGQIQEEMVKIVTQVIEATTKEVLEKFKTEYILEYVYNSHDSPTVYDNPDTAHTFMESWEWTAIQQSATQISSEMFMNPNKMNHETDTFYSTDDYGIGIHGSRGFGGEDARPSMDEILNKTGKSSSLWVSISRPIGYWDIFISEFVNGGKLKQIVDRYSVMYGLTVK